MSSVAFLFPGMGDHYPEMGRGLYDNEPVFREQLDACCRLLRPELGLDLLDVLFSREQAAVASAPARAGLDLRAMLRRNAAPSANTALDQTSLAHPALFAVEYALAQLWIDRGVRPDVMIGYSLGEYVAATLAGVFVLEDALRLVARRARIVQEELPPGSMLAVLLPEADVRKRLSDGLNLAAVNAPAFCVVSGTPDGVAELEGQLQQDGVSSMRVRSTNAFHSPLMEPIVEPFLAMLEGLRLNPPSIPFFSNVTGELIKDTEATDPMYWAKHLTQTVRFSEGIDALLGRPDLVLLEAGPGRTLGSFALLHAANGVTPRVLYSMRSPHESRDDHEVFLEAAQALFSEQAQATNGHESPLTDSEARIARIWKEMLPVEAVRRSDEFFGLGGNSLLASQLVYRLFKEFRVTIKPRLIYDSPSLGALAAEIDGRPAAPARVSAPAKPRLRLPNGMEIYYQHAAEAQQFYRDIFEHRSYVSHGIRLDKGASVFDVGSNIGLFSLFCDREYPGARIFAFEPAPPMFEILRSNMALHSVPASLFNCGISDRAGHAKLTFYPQSSGMSSFHADLAEEKSVLGSILRQQVRLGMTPASELPPRLDDFLDMRFEATVFECAVRTLSDVIEEHSVQQIDLLKIDVQKSELEVLRGLSAPDWDKVRQIVLEVHNTGGRLADVSELLTSHGFEVVTEQDELYVETSILNVYAIKSKARG